MKPREIKKVREALMLSQPEFAARVGVSVDAVRAWEHGRRHPSPRHQRAIVATTQEPTAPATT
jgi:putative transcriptional regulator